MRKPEQLPTAEYVRSILDYDASTGIFKWKITRGRAIAGRVTGSRNARGYLIIVIDSVNYKAHRLAWLYETGKWPMHQIDHCDGDTSNNRFANLRDATTRVNQQNQRKPRSDNTTGYLGVSRSKGRFVAQISVAGKYHSLGYFDTAEEASQAYLECKRLFHEGCTL